VIFVSILVVMFLQSCKENVVDIRSGPAAVPRMNLSIGNSWTYNFRIYNKNGNVTESYNYYRRILRDTMIATDQFYIINEDTAKASNSISKLAIEKNDGYYEVYSHRDSGSIIRESLLLTYKYPASVNSKYLFPSVFNQTTYDTTTIESINSNILVVAGEFNCYKYVTNKNIYGIDSMNIPSVLTIGYEIAYVSEKGVAKIEAYGFSTSTRIPYLLAVMELKSYNLK